MITFLFSSSISEINRKANFTYQLLSFYYQTKITSMGNHSTQSIQNHKQHEIDPPHFMLSNCRLVLTQKNRLLKSSWSFIQRKIYDNWKGKFVSYIQKLFKSEKYEEFTRNPIYDFIFLPEYHEYVEIGYCSTNGVVNMVYEMVEDSLVRDIELRSLNNQPYTQSEIWIMLYILTKTGTYFHHHNQQLGDVRPENIFIAQNEKFIKVATKNSWLCEKSLKSKWLAKQKIFFSEAMLRCMQNSETPSSKIQFNNDDFAIGMTLAECILLQDLSKMYKINQNQILINRQKHISIIQSLLKIKYYPIKLLAFIIGMIQLQEDDQFTSQEVSKCLNQFKIQILAQNSIAVGKNHLQHHFGPKFDKLYSIIAQYKSSQSKKMFINRQLSLSNAYTINGLSTVQMMKRTYDETFNMEILDISANLSPITNKILTTDENNKSWNSTDQKMANFIQKGKRSNVLDQFYLPTTDKKPKSNEKVKKKSQNLKLSPIMIQSDVQVIKVTPYRQKPTNYNTSPIPITNQNHFTQQKNPYLQSPQLKIFEAKKDIYEPNYSFSSPQSYKYESPKINSLNKYKKYFESHELLHLTPEAAQSIIVTNQANERPESYVTFEYSKSKTNSVKRDNANDQFYCPPQSLIKRMKKASQITQVQRDIKFILKRYSLESNRELFDKF